MTAPFRIEALSTAHHRKRFSSGVEPLRFATQPSSLFLPIETALKALKVKV